MPKDLVKSRKVGLSTKIKTPVFYNVIILNDDFTTMEFVVKILTMFFNLSLHKANQVMLKIHKEGYCIVGTYAKDIATTLVSQVNNYSRQNKFPLKAIAESQ